MRSYLILCGSPDRGLEDFDDVAVVNEFRRRALTRETGRAFRSLLGTPLDNRYERPLCESIDRALLLEHGHNPALKWAPLAFSHVHYRFIRYYQFRKRIDRWFDNGPPDRLVLSSLKDRDLLLAAEAVSAKRNIVLESMERDSDPYSYSGWANMLIPFDLPDPGDLDPDVVVKISALFLKARKIRTLVQPYSNLDLKGRPVASFSCNRSISWLAGVRDLIRKTLFHEEPVERQLMPDTWDDPDHPQRLTPGIWDGFDRYDRRLINSVLYYFYRRYPRFHLDRMEKRIRVFLKHSGIERIIPTADTVSYIRMFCQVARPLGIRVECLPHGLSWEDTDSPTTSSRFSPDEILAWNASSRRALEKNGLCSRVVTHPRNDQPFVDTRPVKKPFERIRALVLLSTRTLPSMEQRIDCFEDDFLEIHEGLAQLGICRIDLKCHHTLSSVRKMMEDTVRRLETECGRSFDLIDSRLDSQALMGNYDLVVLGGTTTGILEAMRTATPFIVFRGYLNNVGVLSPFTFPEAYSGKELAERLEGFDADFYNEQFRRCDASLKSGPDPLDSITR